MLKTIKTFGVLHWLTFGIATYMGWGIDIKLFGRYLVISWRSSSCRGLHIFSSPNATPWHHAARRYWPIRPLKRFLRRPDDRCVCETCEAEERGSPKHPLYMACILLLASMSTLSGCDKKVSPELKSMISTAAFSAKERAAALTVIRSGIKAKTPDDQPILDALLESHSKGLNAQAAALNDFLLAIEANSTISKRGIDTIIEMAKNSKAWLEDITALKNHVALTDAQLAWFDAHIEALDEQCQKLNGFAEKIRPPTPPKQTSPPSGGTTPAK